MNKSLKTRIYIYVTGLVLIFQIAVLLPVSNRNWYTNLIKGLSFCGLILIGTLCFYTLILVFRKKARLIEFIGYTAVNLLVLLIAVGLFLSRIAQFNSRPHPRGDTTWYEKYRSPS